jgi:class 3 adenylate cyclase
MTLKMLKLSDMVRKVKGSVQSEDLDRRIYNIFLLIVMFFSPLSIIGNIAQHMHIIAIINPLVLLMITTILYYLSLKNRMLYKFFFCIVFLVFIAIQWIYNGGGSSGGMQYFFLWTFINATILIRGRKLVIYIVLNFIILLGLLIYEHVDGSLIVQYADRTSRLIDIIISAAFTFILAALLIRVIYNEIDKERRISEKLLQNILPKKVISELKEKGITNPEIFKEVTVLFSDIVGFTDISTKLPVDKLIEELNDIFTSFDEIIDKNSCERIKTIGDAYLAVCGLPENNKDHCTNIVNAATDMIDFIRERNLIHDIKWQIRIGVHTGNVIGSVVGIKKYIYDIFGDTVNTASRLENLSEPMKINISTEVMKALDDSYQFEDRGKIEVKGKQQMNMYFVNPS